MANHMVSLGGAGLMSVTSYDILIYIHTLLFVYWLGADLGVYLTSKYVADRNLNLDERFRFMGVLMSVDMGPRTSLILILPIGFQMASMLGISPINGLPLTLIWVFCLAWAGASWVMYLNTGKPIALKIGAADRYIRITVMAAMLLLGIVSLATGSPFADKWLAVKALLFAVVMSLGIYLRLQIADWIKGFAMVREGGEAADTGNDLITAALARSKPAAIALWTGVAIIAFLGKVKPF